MKNKTKQKLENHGTITINHKKNEENIRIKNNKQLTTQGTQWVQSLKDTKHTKKTYPWKKTKNDNGEEHMKH